MKDMRNRLGIKQECMEKRVNFVFVHILIAMLFVAPLKEAHAETTEYIKYEVKSGDSLYSIARQYDLNVSKVMKQNSLKTDVIFPGQLLSIPSSHLDQEHYVVKKGDTLSTIAERKNYSVEEVKRTNGLASDQIMVGQTLVFPSSVEKTTQTDTEEVKEELVEDTFSYLGVPYVWGGKTPKGFDCSGFVYFMLSQYGMDIPRVTSRDYYEMGKEVKRNNLEPGDLVFFAVESKHEISHVGFYVGGNEFISATSSKGIAVYPLDHSYWSQYYVGAKRLF